MDRSFGKKIVSSEATEEEILHIRTGTLDQVEAIALLRAFDPGAWVRIAFDVKTVASNLRSFRRFHEDRSLGKHNIQMGLPEGHSVLLHFSNNGRAYQAVLVSMSSAPSKSKKGEHAMWKHVLPVSTDFAWLPEDVADAFCSLALHQDSTRPYGSFHEVQLGFNEHYQALLHIEGLYYLGETRSVDEFNIFSQMPAERLCLGCGVQSDERFGLMPPQDRGKLFAATLRLMQLVLTDRPQDVTESAPDWPFPCYPLSATFIFT